MRLYLVGVESELDHLPLVVHFVQRHLKGALLCRLSAQESEKLAEVGHLQHTWRSSQSGMHTAPRSPQAARQEPEKQTG